MERIGNRDRRPPARQAIRGKLAAHLRRLADGQVLEIREGGEASRWGLRVKVGERVCQVAVSDPFLEERSNAEAARDRAAVAASNKLVDRVADLILAGAEEVSLTVENGAERIR